MLHRTVAVSLLLCAVRAALAGELVISQDKQCAYQIVVPDKSQTAAIHRGLTGAANVMRDMFRANGCETPVVAESQAAKDKPCIALGATAAAKAAGVDTAALPPWTYVWKVSGKNLIIAGRDWAPPTQQETDVCSLGTVKGATDFMREFGGARFLTPGGAAGIEFLPAPRIAVPDDLSRRKEPMLNYNCGRATTDAASIALNFLNNVTVEYAGSHTHELAIPAEKYAETHPEYFALVSGQRIRKKPHPWKKGVLVVEPHLCYSNKDVQELIYKDMLRSFDAGYPEYLSMQADGFQPCECAECKALFNTADWGEKLWLLNKMWAERLLKDRPGRFLIVGAYTVTGKPPASFNELPPNMRVCTGGYPKAFSVWDTHKVPAGFTSYLHAWGGYHLCGYLPVRTPVYARDVATMYAERKVKGVSLDSAPANMWMLEGPTVYTYARLLDDPKASAPKTLVDEYVSAAFGPAAGPMSRFYDELHETLEAYAQVFGVDNGVFQSCERVDGRVRRYLTWQTKLRLIGFLYPPDTLNQLESLLSQAEKTPRLSDKAKLRLALARREFDYLKSTARVTHMYAAWQTQPGKDAFNLLLNELENRQKLILTWYDLSKERAPGVYWQKPISPDWPMYVGGPGHYSDHLFRNGGSYLSQPVPPFTWDLAEMRKAPLFEMKKLACKKAAAPLTLASPEWSAAAAQKLGPLALGAGAPKAETTVKAAYDASALYVRFDGQLPEGWAAPAQAKNDRSQVLEHESFQLFVSPSGAPARHYRLAVAPGGARYDARHGFVEDALDPRFDEDDVSWNPEWRCECAAAKDKASWSAVIAIPFKSLDAPAPSAGAEWRVNFARVHRISPRAAPEMSLWSANPGTAAFRDPAAFGALAFE